ncbi:hypothetical protein SAMN05428947_102265 [Mucilaginibacter sp. OK283]|jgi:hypothetical protein|nr:hypothetical protein SAMN05428947_102265 [Mucilaginibacter sp. OK283]
MQLCVFTTICSHYFFTVELVGTRKGGLFFLDSF